MTTSQPSGVLVTGGAGYIGSNVAVSLLQAGYRVVIIDDFSNSYISVLDDIGRVSGVQAVCVPGDVRDINIVRSVIESYDLTGVVHLAGLKSAPTSLTDPLSYYETNVTGLLTTLRAAHESGVDRFVFSSSATVYGHPQGLPIPEHHALQPTTPYGHSKLMCERILYDYAQAHPAKYVTALRYFNPVGAHPSGLLGEDPRLDPGNLMPAALRVARGDRPHLYVYGDDWGTPDGTALRDYVHVSDLADGHVAALQIGTPGFGSYNLGTGRASSVLDVVDAVEAASRRVVTTEVRERRPGDAAASYCDPSLAGSVLGWAAKRTLLDAARDGWRAALLQSGVSP